MKKQIENIFSGTKTSPVKSKCPNPKIPIIIDTREKQSLVSANLAEKKANTKFEKLDIGDYLVGNTIIERKTFSDFIGSMINKRLQEQLINIKKYPQHILIIEGFDYRYEKFNIHENAIRGMLLSVATDFKIPTIFTKDEKDTSNFLILTAKRCEKAKSINAMRYSKTPKTLEEQKRFILEGFPGIGPTTAKQLLEKFPTLQSIFNLTGEQLEEIERFDKKKIQAFLKLLKS